MLQRNFTMWGKMFFIVYYFSVIFSPICAVQEESVSINKPVMRSPKSWHFSTDYVRCFCNLPSCVTTGYMCKSSGGGCFSDLLDQSVPQSTVYRGRHGCLELLADKDRKLRCDTKGGVNERTTIKRKENPRSLLLCCHHDMCNHIESPQTKNLINNTLLGDTRDTENSENRYQQQQEPFLYSNSEVWFRAATIAVPICGAVILFVLIALAVKILKNEHQNSTIHKLGPAMYVHAMPQQCKSGNEKYHHEHVDRTYDNLLRREYVPTHHQNTFYSSPNEDYQRQIHVPLLVQNGLNSSSSGNKNEANAKFNLMNCDIESGKSIILEIEKGIANSSGVNIDRNLNSKLKYSAEIDKYCTEKPFVS